MKKIFPWFALCLGILLSTLIWDFISLPYNNANTINGQYSINKINPLNDTLRGLFFIFFPIFSYFGSLIYLNRISIIPNLSTDKNFQIKNDKVYLNFFTIVLIIFSIIEFFSLDYKNYLGELDVHHEGTSLTAQLNFFYKKTFWLGTFFDYGFLGNNLGIFIQFIFGDFSIGLLRFSKIFLLLINKILLILICKEISRNINLEDKEKNIFFLIFTLSTLSLVSFYEDISPIHHRLFIFLFFTLLVFNYFASKVKRKIKSFVIGLFSLLSILFYWDVGTFINVIIIFILIYLIVINQIQDTKYIILGIFLSWLIFYIILPANEFKEFLRQYYTIINISDYLLGIEYPKPFSVKSTRFTKALLLIILVGVMIIKFIYNNSKKENQNIKFFLIYLFVATILFFKSGLMRSDTPHIKYSSGLYMMLLFFFISYHGINYLNKTKYIHIKNIFYHNKSITFIFILICFAVIFLQKNFLNLANILNLKKNFYYLTSVKDEKFLGKNYLNFISQFKELTKNEFCVQQFTDDNAIPYLVNKPTCTKYYVSAHILKNWTEDNFIDELKNNKPTYIVYSSSVNWFKNRNNARNADNFILENYFLFKDLSPWIIYKKR